MNQHPVTDRRSERSERREFGAEWAATHPALFRSEGFFEDLFPEPTRPAVVPRVMARAVHLGSRLRQLVPVHALRLRRV